MLSRAAPTAVSGGNLNSETGVPLACFQVGAAHRWAVLEMGVNHPGEMDALADIVRPDLALITNIGTAHIGLLGSREGIAREKKGIFSRFDRSRDRLPARGRALLRPARRGRAGERIVAYGPASTAGTGAARAWDWMARSSTGRGPGSASPSGGAQPRQRPRRRRRGPRAGRRPARRSARGSSPSGPCSAVREILRGAVATVLFDGYNANPDSMERALAWASEVAWPGPGAWRCSAACASWARRARRPHRALAGSASLARFDLVFLLGDEMRAAHEALAGTPLAGRAAWETDCRRALGRRLPGRGARGGPGAREGLARPRAGAGPAPAWAWRRHS
ncbi:MAG: Mur ligase family protein [Ignavibacteriales bacterium]|nr:Mur ligase family protein [Ignavibacteriales bacterium]